MQAKISFFLYEHLTSKLVNRLVLELRNERFQQILYILSSLEFVVFVDLFHFLTLRAQSFTSCFNRFYFMNLLLFMIYDL